MNEPQNTNKKHKKLISALVILACVLLLVSPYIKEYNSTTLKSGQVVVVKVSEGQSVYSVACNLSEKDLIKTRFTFLLKYYFNRGDYAHIYPGEYKLHKGMCLADILKKVTTPSEDYIKKESFSFTVPEGYSAEMIAARCNRLGICTEAEFLAAVDAADYNYEFINHIPDGNYRHKLEGFLFPSTYEFYVDVTPREMVNKMLAAFEDNYKSKFSTYENMFYNITVASMIEREAAVASEREIISGVIKNRLAKPMRLQIDATAVYAKTNGYYDIENVTGADVKFASDYNTYLNDGLPPGPICNPGMLSVIAAANPQQHNWYYYHTDEVKKDGSHIFTQTYNEHSSTMTN